MRDEADCAKGEGSQRGHEDSDSKDSAESKPVRLENMFNITVEKDLFTIVGTKMEVERIPIKKVLITETLPKAQRTQGLSSSCQSNILRSYQKFKHKS